MKTDELLDAMDPVHWAAHALDFHPDPLQSTVLRSPTRRGILNCCRQWGKSTVTALMALHRAWFNPGALVLAASPSARQSAEWMRKAESFARTLGCRVRGDGDNEISLLLRNGSRLVGLPENEGKVRGFSGVSLLLLDEASRVSDDLYRALRPMVIVSRGALWLMSTPAGARGFFHETWTRGGPDWLRVEAPASACPRILPADLEEERLTQGDRWFRQEYLCEFLEDDDSIFTREWLDQSLSHQVKPL
jgi:hypothetical protein